MLIGNYQNSVHNTLMADCIQSGRQKYTLVVFINITLSDFFTRCMLHRPYRLGRAVGSCFLYIYIYVYMYIFI